MDTNGSAQVLDILDKVAAAEFVPASPHNFVVRPGGSVPAESLLGDPDVSLHCLDDEHRLAYFVQTLPGVDLAGGAFLYLDQYRAAQRLITVPYETLHRLADDLPDPARLILVYSVGRCGSTLLSRALGEVAGVRSYSEPDVFTEIALLRHEDPSRDAEYARLIRSCVRVLGNTGSNTGGRDGGTPTLAVKFRASGIQLGDLFHQVFPDARGLFLHRDAHPWLESMHQGFTPHLPDPAAQLAFLRYVLAQAPLIMPFVARHQRQPTPTEAYLLTWLSVLDRYLTLRRAGVLLLPVAYEALGADPKATLADLLAHCGLPIDRVDAAYGTFAADSQEGTRLSRASRRRNPAAALGAEDFAQARAVLAEYPVVDPGDPLVRGLIGP
ncbi:MULTISPECIES: sulfotransferase [unclassified Micromonospora]|uniref:sulfotransferase n=1 Tax=unclassified Micromonospora TaxID=2617518 RepID=UPI0036423D1D